MKNITQVVENQIKPYIDSHDRAAEAIIAPVETVATSASDDYAVGKQLILNNVLYDVIAPITTGDALVVNTNIKASDNVSSNIEALTKELEDEAATRSAQGAKNILPFDLDAIKALNTNGTWAGNVYTYRGVDFTVNSDGTISATGTATGGNASIKTFAASSNYEMLGKEVILNGCPSGGSASTYRIQAYRMASADGSTGTYFDDGAGTDAFTVLNNASGTVGSFAVAVYENTTVTNLLFKPMVRLASDPDATYQQYAKTNRELTAENQTLTNKVANMQGVNLLDNPWFTVNQRGQSSYSANNTYSVDRWKIIDNDSDLGTVTVNADKTITIDNENGTGTLRFRQTNSYTDDDTFKNLLGKRVTLSVMKSDGTIVSDSAIIPLSPSDWTAHIILPITTSANLLLQANGNRVIVTFEIYAGAGPFTVKAIKLELGSVSTLAQDTAPNYAEELLKCQRYFYRLNLQQYTSFGIGIANSATSYQAPFDLPNTMRATPSVSASDASVITLRNGETHHRTVTALSVFGNNARVLNLSITASGLTAGTPYLMYFDNSNAHYIDFSADL